MTSAGNQFPDMYEKTVTVIVNMKNLLITVPGSDMNKRTAVGVPLVQKH